ARASRRPGPPARPHAGRTSDAARHRPGRRGAGGAGGRGPPPRPLPPRPAVPFPPQSPGPHPPGPAPPRAPHPGEAPVPTPQPRVLDIEIANGPAPGGPRPATPRSASGGRGVRGMRERAELYGGRLDARPCPDGGFSVTAAIPCDPVPEPA